MKGWIVLWRSERGKRRWERLGHQRCSLTPTPPSSSIRRMGSHCKPLWTSVKTDSDKPHPSSRWLYITHFRFLRRVVGRWVSCKGVSYLNRPGATVIRLYSLGWDRGSRAVYGRKEMSLYRRSKTLEGVEKIKFVFCAKSRDSEYTTILSRYYGKRTDSDWDGGYATWSFGE